MNEMTFLNITNQFVMFKISFIFVKRQPENRSTKIG